MPIRRPAALRPNDTVGIIAPAGPSNQRDALAGSITALERLGFRVRYDERIFESVRYLAGTDEARAAELMRFFEAPDVRAIVPLRGGYGCARLLPLLDERRLRHQCKVFMGFSDSTTLHLFFWRRFGWATVHGPMAISPALAGINGDEETHLFRLWTDPEYLPFYSVPQLQAWSPGVAEGRIVGGCLSIVVASLGTAHEIQTEGRILFLEELGEAPYRIDRMLMQLRLAGKLDCAAGILLGDFVDCAPSQGDYSVDEVLKELLEGLQVPVLAGFPAGHGAVNRAFALGSPVRLDAAQRTVEALEPLVTA